MHLEVHVKQFSYNVYGIHSDDTKTTYGVTYGDGLIQKIHIKIKAPEVVMSNYIIPSIESLSGLDNYSQIEHWGTFTIAFPKTAKLVK